ncbi:hypothetical protein CHU98_g11975 [Xylaria longipes]|nr:hypothetical protein CHU98_g11975 [Xylaria longipes]
MYPNSIAEVDGGGKAPLVSNEESRQNIITRRLGHLGPRAFALGVSFSFNDIVSADPSTWIVGLLLTKRGGRINRGVSQPGLRTPAARSPIVEEQPADSSNWLVARLKCGLGAKDELIDFGRT